VILQATMVYSRANFLVTGVALITKKSLALFVRRLPQILGIVVAATMIVGCPDRKNRAQVVKGKPALELKKAISFPLDTAGLPQNRETLIDSIRAGLSGRLVLPEDRDVVVAEGGNYPMLKKLVVDLTGAKIDTGTKVPKLKPRGPIQSGVFAEQFEFKAQPVNIDGAKIDLNIVAQKVQLGLQRDNDNRPILIVAAAQQGQVDCETTNQDLSTIFKASANERGKRYGLSVQKAKIQLLSDNAHNLKADLRFASRLLLVPISLHFTARVDVDTAGNARLSNLTCDGDDVAGTLITGFIRPALSDYNNKTMPLIAFPTEKIRLHDVRVQVEGDAIRIAAAFGS
jgi:hypothetical protein